MILRLLAMLWLGTPGVPAAAAETLRLDYVHSGGLGQEMYSVDELVREPLPWAGNPGRPLDKLQRGKYLFSVHDEASGEALYSRSFSSIYGEWETTAEARGMRRSFHESVRFPKPDKPFVVSIARRDNDNAFVTQWRQRFDPRDYLITREPARYREDRVAIQAAGAPADKVDLLILGDGYTGTEQDAFIARSRQLVENLFSRYPFNLHRDSFNVWAIAPRAAESGVSRPSTGYHRDSPLGTRYDAFGSERYMLSFDNKAWRRVASSAPYDAVIILANSETYGGGGIYGLYSTVSANNPYADYLFSHEFGHHFAGLADEYYTSAVAYQAGEIREPYEPNVTAMLDPQQLKWGHRASGNTALPTDWPKADYEEHALAYQERRRALRARQAPEAEMTALFRENQRIVEAMFEKHPNRDLIGAFEGANYQARGYYRSAMNCLMFTRTRDYCDVCGAAVVEVIDSLTTPASE